MTLTIVALRRQTPVYVECCFMLYPWQFDAVASVTRAGVYSQIVLNRVPSVIGRALGLVVSAGGRLSRPSIAVHLGLLGWVRREVPSKSRCAGITGRRRPNRLSGGGIYTLRFCWPCSFTLLLPPLHDALLAARM